MGSSFSCLKPKETSENKSKSVASKKQQNSRTPTKDTAKAPQAQSTLISVDDVAARRQSERGSTNDHYVPVTREETANSSAPPRRQIDIQIDTDLPQNFKV